MEKPVAWRNHQSLKNVNVSYFLEGKDNSDDIPEVMISTNGNHLANQAPISCTSSDPDNLLIYSPKTIQNTRFVDSNININGSEYFSERCNDNVLLQNSLTDVFLHNSSSNMQNLSLTATSSILPFLEQTPISQSNLSWSTMAQSSIISTSTSTNNTISLSTSTSFPFSFMTSSNIKPFVSAIIDDPFLEIPKDFVVKRRRSMPSLSPSKSISPRSEFSSSSLPNIEHHRMRSVPSNCVYSLPSPNILSPSFSIVSSSVSSAITTSGTNVKKESVTMPKDVILGKRTKIMEDTVSPKPESPVLNDFPCLTKLFRIVAQPNLHQRKSYRRENRFLCPNPITIQMSSSSCKVHGKVKVKLVKENGSEIDPSSSEENSETDTDQRRCNLLGGDLEKPLEEDGKALFSLKCLITSKGQFFRLQFIIEFYFENDGDRSDMVEILLSNPFKVTSNRNGNKRCFRAPILQALKPAEGFSTVDTEVWIKGSHFTDDVKVFFGEQEAKLVDIDCNVVSCFAPIRPDLQESTTIEVSVINFNQPQHPKASKMRNKKLMFTYVVP